MIDNNEAESVPSALEFVLNFPLYRRVPIDGDRKIVKRLRNLSEAFDLFCPYCRRPSTFRFPSLAFAAAGKGKIEDDDQFIHLSAYCTRAYTHRLHFFVEIGDDFVQKVGQSPSYGDILSGDMKEELAELAPEDRREMMKALRLFSSDVAIGAFVYLRRVFERVIDRAHREGDSVEGWADKRMYERIEALGDRLPPAVAKNAVVWKVLSRGIHEMSEADCQRYFEVMRAAISQILEQEAHRKRARKQDDDMRRALSAISAEIETGGGPK